MRIFIDGRRSGYSPDSCGKTMTVGEIINYLSQFDEDAEVFLRNDRGYTYGNISYESFDEEEEEDNEVVDEDY